MAIQTRAPNQAFSQGPLKVGLVDDPASRGVDHNRITLHHGEFSVGDQILCIFGQRHVDGDDIRGLDDFVQGTRASVR